MRAQPIPLGQSWTMPGQAHIKGNVVLTPVLNEDTFGCLSYMDSLSITDFTFNALGGPRLNPPDQNTRALELSAFSLRSQWPRCVCFFFLTCLEKASHLFQRGIWIFPTGLLSIAIFQGILRPKPILALALSQSSTVQPPQVPPKLLRGIGR
ncbi:hypothetical protein L228DRAFT_129208 [Xylona heveae TC161]|uniref:Uncharacterized protein n=1 Tax=Xylona heveae (strain CBS 132557 / TC161) TaxID=1328760 RepID=A0A165GTP8_XYLHT|nr:hypothetical protein L228DRAFT_129208 [Xylona heveae TC161]KZF22586.1 hypothetical protein L228DRAFT_129208 [Xylona heveae TC161]